MSTLMNVTQENESGGVGNQCVAFVDLHIQNFVGWVFSGKER